MPVARFNNDNTSLAFLPVNSLSGTLPIDATQAKNLLTEISREVQAAGWHYNSFYDYTLSRDTDNKIPLADNIMRVDLDINKYKDTPDPTHLCDIMEFNYKQYPKGHFRVIHASPPCIYYSQLQHTWIGREKRDPVTKEKYIFTREMLDNKIKISDKWVKKTIEIIKNFTIIIDGKGDYEKIEERSERIKEEIAVADNRIEAEKLQDRLARLASGVAVINVGGSTEIEMVERKHRIEDALEAVRSAQMDGIVPGGGVALLRAAKDLYVEVDNQDQDLGVKIILEAIKSPLRQMAENAGESADIIFNMVDGEDGNLGWDFASRGIVDMIHAGVIDPVKVTKSALQNAASVAGTLITTNYAIVDS